MTDPSWASHPNAALRGRIADYLGRGWTVASLGEASAVMTRLKRSARPAWLVMNPMHLLFSYGRKRTDEVLLAVGDDGEVRESVL